MGIKEGSGIADTDKSVALVAGSPILQWAVLGGKELNWNIGFVKRDLKKVD